MWAPRVSPLDARNHEGSDAARNQRHQQRSGVVIGQGIYLRTPKGYTYRPLLWMRNITKKQQLINTYLCVFVYIYNT